MATTKKAAATTQKKTSTKATTEDIYVVLLSEDSSPSISDQNGFVVVLSLKNTDDKELWSKLEKLGYREEVEDDEDDNRDYDYTYVTLNDVIKVAEGTLSQGLEQDVFTGKGKVKAFIACHSDNQW
jgi:hypothetical protein